MSIRSLAINAVKGHLKRTRQENLWYFCTMVIMESSYGELHLAAAGETEGIVKAAKELQVAAAQL